MEEKNIIINHVFCKANNRVFRINEYYDLVIKNNNSMCKNSFIATSNKIGKRVSSRFDSVEEFLDIFQF